MSVMTAYLSMDDCSNALSGEAAETPNTLSGMAAYLYADDYTNTVSGEAAET